MNLRSLWTALPLSSVRVTDPFWKRWQDVVHSHTLEIQYEQLEQTGRLENFRRAIRGEEGTFEGFRYNDSDVYKWLEAACYCAQLFPSDSALRARIVSVVEILEQAQMADGYIQTYYQLNCIHLRWRNTNWGHEMYCGGHMLEAAVAYEDALGDGRMLAIATKYVDHVMSVFGPNLKNGFDGHEEFELALLKLAHIAPERAQEYRDYARWMVEIRGTRPTHMEAERHDDEAAALATDAFWRLVFEGENYTGHYAQDHLPLREHDRVVGHAVRAMYLYTAATEAFADRGDTAAEAAIERVWSNLTEKQMYITGGIGQTGDNEGFSNDYDLPNRTAYAETCAACGLVFWARALVNCTGEARFAQVMERALYNGALAGINESGDRFFYDNPLESRGEHERQGWFTCACCPPNIARLIASVGSYAASATDSGYAIHLPMSLELPRGTVEHVPGQILLKNTSAEPLTFELRRGARYESHTVPAGETLALEDFRTARWVHSHPLVLENSGKVALVREPFVYCLEEHDLGAPPQQFLVDLEKAVGRDGDALIADGVQERSTLDALYGEATIDRVPVQLRFIPYHQWANRGKGAMQVWVRELQG